VQERTLGQNQLEVSAIGFGCMGLNFSSGQPVDRESG
jgi:aryl-alcohol dehydrogenase-like predicted oxidoreductase